MSEYIELPADKLSAEALQGLIEEYITREGTDYGDREFTLEEKVAQLREQLREGRVVIVFDPVSESSSLLSKE